MTVGELMEVLKDVNKKLPLRVLFEKDNYAELYETATEIDSVDTTDEINGEDCVTIVCGMEV